MDGLLKKKYSKTFFLGQVVEDKFRYVIENDISGTHKVFRATPEEDINHRTDFIVDGMRIDVKATKYIKRCDRRMDTRVVVIEFTNINGKYVFNKNFTHYAFEVDPLLPAFLLVPKQVVNKVIKDIAKDIKSKIGGILFVDRRIRQFRNHLPKMFAFYRRPTDNSICFIMPHNYALNKMLEAGGVLVYSENLPYNIKSARVHAEEEIRRKCKEKFGNLERDVTDYWYQYKPDDYEDYSKEIFKV